MERKVLSAILALTSMIGWAAGPAQKVDPVAEGYPAWTGLTEQNRLFGRRIEAGDLRQRVVIVVEFDAAKAQELFLRSVGLASSYSGLAAENGDNWEHREIHKDTIVLFINRGAKTDPDAIKAALKSKNEADQQKLPYFSRQLVPIYQNVTFAGAPDAGGNYPFYYVLGPDNATPLAKGSAAGKDLLGLVKPAVSKALKALKDAGEWRPFYGRLTEMKNFKDLPTLIEKHKPLDQYEAKLKKTIASSDAEKSKEAQILYDSLVQTRSDLFTRIGLEASSCPHRAAYDVMILQRYWPSSKKKLGKGGKSKGGESDVLCTIFIKMMEWADPNFKCKSASEAKKIVVDLNKMKKTLEKLKESKTIVVQNGALLLDAEIDDLISTVPTKVPEK